jgi:hypothetical protein
MQWAVLLQPNDLFYSSLSRPISVAEPCCTAHMCEPAKWVGCSLQGVLARAKTGDKLFWEQSRFFLFEGVGGEGFFVFSLVPDALPSCSQRKPSWIRRYCSRVRVWIASLEEYGKEGMCHVLLPMQYLKFFTRNHCLGWLDGWSSGCDNCWGRVCDGEWWSAGLGGPMLDNRRHRLGCCFCQCLQPGATLFNFCFYLRFHIFRWCFQES